MSQGNGKKPKCRSNLSRFDQILPIFQYLILTFLFFLSVFLFPHTASAFLGRFSPEPQLPLRSSFIYRESELVFEEGPKNLAQGKMSCDSTCLEVKSLHAQIKSLRLVRGSA